jgi:hypothetical protein
VPDPDRREEREILYQRYLRLLQVRG